MLAVVFKMVGASIRQRTSPLPANQLAQILQELELVALQCLGWKEVIGPLGP